MFGASKVFTWISIFAISAAVVNSIGIFVIFKYREWAERAKGYFMSFAAGVLITTSLVSILPEAVEKNSYAGLAALGGFLFMFFSNEIIKHYTKQETLAFGVTAAEGIAIHSLVDGVVYAVTFSASILAGFLAGIGLIIHEFAEGVITYLVLLKGNVREKVAAWYAFLIAALTTPVGAFIAYPFIEKLKPSDLNFTLGFVAGVLLYVSASHLLPEAKKESKVYSALIFLGGVVLSLFIAFSELV